jgi:hypothetical protein
VTKRIIDALAPRARTYIIYDDNLPGFGCRVTPNGARSWIVEYRPHGGGRAVAKKRITLAPVSVLTPDQARETAGDILASVRLGHDVAPDRAARRSSPLVTALVDRFMSEEVRPTRKPTTAALYDMYFRRYILPELGQKRAREVVLADVAKLHRKIGTTKPVTANRVLELISGLYTWAARLGEVPKDLRPAHGVTRVSIASIRGRATGVGSELALASDMRFASREMAILSQWEVGAGLVPGGGPMARLPRLMGRGRALEVLLGADDIGGDLAELYGYVNRALPDDELDAFVDALAMRLASFDKQAIAETKNFVNVASLPPDTEIAPEWAACLASIQRPAAQTRIKKLMELGFHKPGDVENRLGYHVGQLGNQQV